MNLHSIGLKINRFKKCTLALGIALTLPAALMAEEAGERSGPYIEFFGGVNFVPDEDFSASGSAEFRDGEASFESGFVTGLAAGYRLNSQFAMELEYAYRSNDVDEVVDGDVQVVSGGDLASVGVFANAYYFPPLSEQIFPYVGLGFGFMQEIDADLDIPGTEGQRDLEDSGVAWQAMLGVEVPLPSSWFLTAEGRFTAAPGPEISNDAGSYDFDYNNLSLTFGVGYQF